MARANLIKRYGRTRRGGPIVRQCDLSRAIVDNLGEAVLVLDRDGRLLMMNRAAEHLLGRTQTELGGRCLHEIIHFRHPDGTPFPAQECPLVNAARLGRSVEVPEDAFVRKDGTMLPVAYVASPLDVEGQVLGIVVAFRDVTGRKRAEEERERLLEEIKAEQGRAETLVEDARRATSTL